MRGALTYLTPADAELVESFTTYQRSRAFSPNTLLRRRLSLNRFALHMSPASITTATAVDVDEWTAKLRSARTKHAYRSDLSVFYKWAVRRGLVEVNPVLGTDSVRVPKSLPKPAKEESIAAAFSIARADTQLALMLGALAGLRISEIVNLDACNVHLDADPPVIIVREAKWGKDRIVPLHPRLILMLRGHSGWLFPSSRGGHVSAEALRRRLDSVMDHLEASGFERFTMHALRHYFGTSAARLSGGNVVLVASLMGRESTNTMMGYIVPFLAEGADVVGKITGGRVDDELTARRAQRHSA